MTGVQFPAGAIMGFFSLPPYPDWVWSPPSLLFNVYWGALTPEVKQLGCEADYSPPSSAIVLMGGAVPPHLQYSFMACCLVKHRNNLTL